MTEPSDIYQERITLFTEKFKKAERDIQLISSIRLVLALGIIASFYAGLTQDQHFFYLFFLLIFGFVVFVIIHSKLFYNKTLLANYIRINQEELRSLEGITDSFQKGVEFIDHQHPYTYDLDIFGTSSLYEFLCRTVSIEGKNTLAENLSKPLLEVESIEKKQEAVKELAQKLEFRQSFRAIGLSIREEKEDKENIRGWVKGPNYFNQFHSKLRYLLYLLSVITIIAGGFGIYEGKFNLVLIACLIINGVIYGVNAKKINALHSKVSKKRLILRNYSNLISLSEKEEFGSERLLNFKNQFEDASDQFKRISNYVGWLDQRLNILFSPFANALLLYDLHCCLFIEEWKKINENKVMEWLKILGEIDALNSLANFTYNQQELVFPSFQKDKPLFEARSLSHPLINKKKRISNDFILGMKDRAAIVTGANMAGKSTFLRTLGVNLVLAYAGAPVAASEMKVSLMSIFTSMRISDSLKDHASYFYAELQRLKLIKENLKLGISSMVLLDEMLKGTNSNDKQQGSKAFIESLLPYNALCVVATHDLVLGKLEDEYPDLIKNYSFESFLNQNHLSFDYKIREGTAKNTNASFLMKDLGII
jgi:hypothetical protein